jgi:hypothetical protein
MLRYCKKNYKGTYLSVPTRVARPSGFPGKFPDFESFSGFFPASGFFRISEKTSGF